MAKHSKGSRKWSRTLDWLIAAPGAIASALAPWYELILSFPIISDYWQPHLRSTATGIAAIAFVAVNVRNRGGARHGVSPSIGLSAAVAGTMFAVCLAFWLATGFWNPGVPAVYGVWFLWILAYIGLFGSIAVLLAGIALFVTRGNY